MLEDAYSPCRQGESHEGGDIETARLVASRAADVDGINGEVGKVGVAGEFTETSREGGNFSRSFAFVR